MLNGGLAGKLILFAIPVSYTHLKGKLEVPVLDATAIGVSVLRRDFGTAGSVMFLLGIGEILEEWTHKKSVGDLVRSMSLNITKVWLKTEDGKEVLVDAETIRQGDQIVVHMGNQIPFDGVVVSGEAMVNQASLTGEPLPVQKNAEKYVYAGTVLEEGELVIRVAAQSLSLIHILLKRFVQPCVQKLWRVQSYRWLWDLIFRRRVLRISCLIS